MTEPAKVRTGDAFLGADQAQAFPGALTATGQVARKRPASEPQKNRVIRVRDSVWTKAQERAEREGVTVAEVVRRYLERWGKG